MGIGRSLDRSGGLDSDISRALALSPAGGGGGGGGTTLAGVYDITASPYNCSTGATDNTAGLQAAINDAKASGGKVYVPPGVFKFASPLSCDLPSKSFSISGAASAVGGISPFASELQYTGTGSAAAITFYSAYDFGVENIRFTYTSTSFTGDLIDIDGGPHAADVTNWRIVGCSSFNLGASRTARSIVRMNKTINGAIYDCGWGGAVNNIRIGDPGGSYVVGVRVSNCTFNYANDAMILVGSADAENIIIDNNRFEASTNTPGIRGARSAVDGGDNGMYSPVIACNWFGDAGAPTIWIDGLTTVLQYAGTISGNRFAECGLTGTHLKFLGGTWLIQANSFEDGTAIDAYSPASLSFTSVTNAYNVAHVTPASWNFAGLGQPARFTFIGEAGANPNQFTNQITVRSNIANINTSGPEDLLIGSQANAGLATLPNNKAAVYKQGSTLTLQAADNGTNGSIVLATNAGGTPSKMLEVDRTGVGFHGVTPVAQPARVGLLTDSTGGTVSSTLASGIADTVAKNAIASLAAKVNALETIIHNLGLSA